MNKLPYWLASNMISIYASQSSSVLHQLDRKSSIPITISNI